jgi:hypothetical protein
VLGLHSRQLTALAHLQAAKRMHRLAPHAKVIFLLRNPVDRAYSHYRHVVRADLVLGRRENDQSLVSARCRAGLQCWSIRQRRETIHAARQLPLALHWTYCDECGPSCRWLCMGPRHTFAMNVVPGHLAGTASQTWCYAWLHRCDQGERIVPGFPSAGRSRGGGFANPVERRPIG